jgi:hypothetical protein
MVDEAEKEDNHDRKAFIACPDCGKPMSAHALLCRDCYKKSGGIGAPIYRAAQSRGEASPRSRTKPEGTVKRSYTKPYKEPQHNESSS